MKNAAFGFSCGSFGGVRTSADGYIIPIAKTKPFGPEMLPSGGPPPGGARYRLKVYEGKNVACMVKVYCTRISGHKVGVKRPA